MKLKLGLVNQITTSKVSTNVYSFLLKDVSPFSWSLAASMCLLYLLSSGLFLVVFVMCRSAETEKGDLAQYWMRQSWLILFTFILFTQQQETCRLGRSPERGKKMTEEREGVTEGFKEILKEKVRKTFTFL